VEAIVAYGEPRSLVKVQRFLGMVGYYRRFIAEFATVAAPLFAARSDFSELDATQRVAFEQLKRAMTTTPVMRMPDFAKPFVLITDRSGNWSNLGAAPRRL
jgi:hypothetical protein